MQSYNDAFIARAFTRMFLRGRTIRSRIASENRMDKKIQALEASMVRYPKFAKVARKSGFSTVKMIELAT